MKNFRQDQHSIVCRKFLGYLLFHVPFCLQKQRKEAIIGKTSLDTNHGGRVMPLHPSQFGVRVLLSLLGRWIQRKVAPRETSRMDLPDERLHELLLSVGSLVDCNRLS